MRTAQAGQVILFLLTMLLAGMVLSNLVEEKANKIIEILAAAIPMDAVFLGKLFAMLAVSLVGIAVWATVIGGCMGLSGLERMFGGAISLGNLPEPGGRLAAVPRARRGLLRDGLPAARLGVPRDRLARDARCARCRRCRCR